MASAPDRLGMTVARRNRAADECTGPKVIAPRGRAFAKPAFFAATRRPPADGQVPPTDSWARSQLVFQRKTRAFSP
jgi:hypothetical protein